MTVITTAAIMAMTTATIILAAIAAAITAKDLVDRAAKYLAGCEKDGKIYRCLAECMGFAEYPQVYGAYPWSLGPGLGVLRKKGV